MTDKTAVLICGHGSRDSAAILEFDRFAAAAAVHLTAFDVGHAYLEFARPVIKDGLDALIARGARKIVCVPAMLFAAGHVKNDLPSEIQEYAHQHPEVELLYGRDLALDPRLLEAARARLEAAEASAPPVPREETLLLVIGRGTRDPDANSNVAKVTRMLWEGMGYGWAETAYSGVAHPLGDAGLDHAARLGYRRIVVFPYFLFTGVLMRRIYDWVDAAQERYLGIEFLKAPYLSDHPRVVETLVDRVAETLNGQALMNCSLCKYRERIIGHEADQGAPQAGHHHHVRGIGTDHDHGE
jgi:sirohydrochlorin cobaltochelatase